jgi:hypothetical protein
MKEAFSSWVENLRTNRFYRQGQRAKVQNVWSFKCNETHLISAAGYAVEFNTSPGIYLFLRDEGTPQSYVPIYIGMAGGQVGSPSSQSISDRIYQRYVPRERDYPYKPPKQLQIVDWFGKEIRTKDPAWHTHRKELELQGTSRVRLDDAEFFAKFSVEAPYLTFHPVPRAQQETVDAHKLRIQSLELALIRAANDIGFELCNKQGYVNWGLIS